MLKFFHKKIEEKGFTMVELMVVIGVIGILSVIVIPQFLQHRKRGYVATINSDCRNAYTAAIAYITDHPEGIVTTADLKAAGYEASSGVGTRVSSWVNDGNFQIICEGDPDWDLGTGIADYSVLHGVLIVHPAEK